MITLRVFVLFGGLLTFSHVMLAQTPSPVVLKFANLRPDAATVPAYIMFGGDTSMSAINLANSRPITPGVSYRLSDLSAGVALSKLIHGRIYFSLGSPLTSASAANGYSPNFANPSLADFTTRWDKVELDLDTAGGGLAGGANLSAQDFFGLPLQIDSNGGHDRPAKLTWRESTANVFTILGTMSGFAVSTVQNATGALALGNNGVNIPNVGGVVRVISPASVAPINGAGQTVYPAMAKYIAYLRTGSTTNPGQPVRTVISGHNGQLVANGPFQTYNLVAIISNTTGDLTLQGTVNNGAGDLPMTIVVPSANLTDHAVFGANPTWTLTQGQNVNQIVEKVVADYFAGLNFGLVGSRVNNPVQSGTTLGDSPSWTWYGNNPDGIGQLPLPVTDAFAYAQPSNPDFYMQYAGYLTSVSDAYGFAYNDRLQSPLASFTDGATVILSILPDTPLLSAETPAEISVRSIATRARSTRLAPGSIATIGGKLPVSSTVQAPGRAAPLPLTLGGLKVMFNDSPAPIFQADPNEVVVQIPWELHGVSRTTVFTEGRGTVSLPQEVEIATFAPELLTVKGLGTGQALAFDANYQAIDAGNPAKTGSLVVFYGTGLGPVVNQPTTGSPAPRSPLAETLTRPEVSIGQMSAPVHFCGLTPGTVGLYQINVRVPFDTPVGPAIPVTVGMEGTQSNVVALPIADSPAR